jgi:hypothetical protein
MTVIRLFGRFGAAVAVLALGLAQTAPVAAHGPDPTLGGGAFGQNQGLAFRWRAGNVPPTVMQTAVKDAAADLNVSRRSKAPTFAYASTGSSWVMYGGDVGCGINGLACFTRTVPSGFTMSFREQGHSFDWGVMRWCQFYASPPDGCYDAENIALDEFGHVTGLGHHVNYSTDSDYRDAVVQTYSRTKPQAGYDANRLGRCDVAALQMLYDLTTSSTLVSTCLDLNTTLGLSAPSSIAYGASASMTATLRVVDDAAYDALHADYLSSRTVVLQRRTPGTTTWSDVVTMTASGSGTYTASQAPRSATEYRAVFRTPTNEGVNGSSSSARTVTVGACTGSGCPLAAPRAASSVTGR